jgi:type IV secretion system protein VirD4
MTPTKVLIVQMMVVFAVVLGGLWGATQWTASMLGHQPLLGTPWFQLFEIPIYYPWRLFEWWFAFAPYAPDLFNKAGLIAAAGGISGIGLAILGSVWRARHNAFVTTYGSARWATEQDIRRSGLFQNQGLILGLRDSQYLRHEGPEHVLAFAPTRSGKGVGLVVPTLLSWTGSAIIHDIKGENWHVTSGWRSKFSHCLLFNPVDPKSAKYNPLLEVRKGLHEVRDVQNIADILVDPEGALEHRNHWEKTAHALLVGVILHVLYAEEDKSLNRVATFLSDPKHSLESVLYQMMNTNHLETDTQPKPHPVVASVARELLNKSENERSGVLSTALSFLSLYRDPVIANNTSCCDWQIKDLMNGAKPVSLYLVIPPSDLNRTKPLVRLILNQIARRLTERLDWESQNEQRHQLLLMLDEFPALGRLAFFESALAYMAGYGMRCFIIAQSLNQITKAYGENNSIMDNAHVRIAFAANDERTARRISDSLGTATEQRAQRNYAGHRLSPWLGHVMVSRQETPRPLLTPGEVMQLGAKDALVFISGMPPIKAEKVRFYEDENFLSRCLQPLQLKNGNTTDKQVVDRNDWTGLVQPKKAPELNSNISSDTIVDASDTTDLNRTPWQKDPAPKVLAEQAHLELGFLDDDFEGSDELGTAQDSSPTIKRVHAITRDDDDLMPAF